MKKLNKKIVNRGSTKVKGKRNTHALVLVFANCLEFKFINTSNSPSHFAPCKSSSSSWVKNNVLIEGKFLNKNYQLCQLQD